MCPETRTKKKNRGIRTYQYLGLREHRREVRCVSERLKKRKRDGVGVIVVVIIASCSVQNTENRGEGEICVPRQKQRKRRGELYPCIDNGLLQSTEYNY